MSIKSLIQKTIITLTRQVYYKALSYLLKYDTKNTLNGTFGRIVEEINKEMIAPLFDFKKYSPFLLSYIKHHAQDSLPEIIIDNLPLVFPDSIWAPQIIIDNLPLVFPDNIWAPQYRNHKLFTQVFNQPKKISFSQSGEDLLIRYIFDQIQVEHPSYLDIGAHHPYYISNTALFYLSGSKGINIEPDPSLFSRFIEARPDDVNLNIAVSDKNGSADLLIFGESTLNTLSDTEAEDYVKEGMSLKKRITVQTRTIQGIIKEYCDGKFPHILSLDVEGLDLDILKQINYEESAPLVICVESISYSNTGRGIKRTEITDYLKQFGYMVYADTNINSILVKQACWER